MGEGSTRVSAARDPNAGRTKGEDAVAEETWRLRREIDATRGELDRYIEELQRRRRELTDVKLQVRRHPAIVVGLGVAVAAVVGAAVLGARRARKRKAVSRVRRALGALGSLPPAPRPPAGGRMLDLFLDAGLPLGVALAKGLLRRDSGSVARKTGR